MGSVVSIIMKLWPAPWSWYMYLGTRSARAAAPDLEAAEAELAAATRAGGVVATEPRRALGRRRALDANTQSNFCFPCYECVLLPEIVVLLVGVTLRPIWRLGVQYPRRAIKHLA